MFTRMPPTSAYSSSLTRRQWVVPHRVRRHCPLSLSLSLYPLWLCNCSQLFVAHSYAHRVYIQLFAIINDNTRMAFCQVVAAFLHCFPVFVYSRSVLVFGPLVTQRVNVTNQDVVFPGVQSSVRWSFQQCWTFCVAEGWKRGGHFKTHFKPKRSYQRQGRHSEGAGVAPPPPKL